MLNSLTINKTFFDRAFNYSYINELWRNLKFPRLFYITPYIYIHLIISNFSFRFRISTHPVYARICIPEFARSPFSLTHIYIHICILSIRLQVSGKLYDSDGEAFRRITFLGIDFTTPLYLYYRRFIRVETSYLRGYTCTTRRRGGRKERGKAGYSTDGMKWNNKGREEGDGRNCRRVALAG